MKRASLTLQSSLVCLSVLVACGGEPAPGSDATTDTTAIDTVQADTEAGSDTSVDDTADDVAIPTAYDQANVERGAHLYDLWWAVKEVAPPTDDHPLYPTDGFYAGTGATTWRCSECHGWDYRGAAGQYKAGVHYTGIKGFWGAEEAQPIALFETLSGGLTDHDFKTAAGLTDADLWDLVRFMREGAPQQDGTGILNGTAFTGTASAGAQLYTDRCEQCHGAEGTRFEILPELYLGTTVRAEPYRAVHRMSFGQPAEPSMPAARMESWTMGDIANLGAYIQTFPDEAGAEMSVTRGGRLYDDWTALLKVAAPQYPHPLYPETGPLPDAQTWRCVNCHAWDYKGRDGLWSAGHPSYTGSIGVLNAASQSRTVLYGKLTGDLADHDFLTTTRMTQDDIWNLVDFLRSGVIDTAPYIDASGDFIGNSVVGSEVFGANCSRCHGIYGNEAPLPRDATLGAAANNEAHRVFHKIRNGLPANPMMARLLEEGGYETADVQADLGKFLQTLPTH